MEIFTDLGHDVVLAACLHVWAFCPLFEAVSEYKN